jgi:hypothetical protein
MRIAVELEAFGETMSDVIADATKQWQLFMKDTEAVLPHDTEVSVQPHTADSYRGTVFARVRVETND